MFDMKRAPQWEPFLNDPEVVDILTHIADTIDPAVTGKEYYPAPEHVLRFLRMETLVKYCIVGMDPYPSFNERDGIPIATGRSFEVSELYGQGWDYKIRQASLRNMLKAIYYNETGTNPELSVVREKIASGEFDILPPTDWFNNMEAQGVLFLNSTLTVEAGKPGSHQKLWEPFRAKLIPFLEDMGCTFMLWGNNAQTEVPAYLSEKAKTAQVLTAPHPRMAEFVRENTFREAKDINWLGESSDKKLSSSPCQSMPPHA
ncbi:MAG: hypothetical protein IJ230_02570 [Clostridia bacterium]|nr:hypothetical protein [Clostridia bacterium]